MPDYRIQPMPGQIRRLRITETHDYDLVGTLLAADEAEVRRPPRRATSGLINIVPQFAVV